jgi:thymidine phosphorylase
MFKIRKVAIDTYPENTAFLLRNDNGYGAEQFQALRKIEISQDQRSILATLAIMDDEHLLSSGEIGLGEQAFRRLGLPEGALVSVAQATPPRSLDAVRRKIGGDTLSDSEIVAIIRDIASHHYSPMEIGAFLVACAGFMTTQETLALTRAMADAGNRLTWSSPLIVDKHCIGGIPGNRTSMIVVPIVAAHGLIIPKTSSRAITSPSGTADTMEVLANVDISGERMQEIVAREHAVLAWGGRVNLSPADDILISVERPLRIDTFEQMVASILSKKLAAGSTHLVIDIPIGPTAKVRAKRGGAPAQAVRICRHKVGLTIDVVVTDGSQPVGRGIGPVLEARDVMAVLRNDADAPTDLRDRALMLAGRVLDFDPALEGGRGPCARQRTAGLGRGAGRDGAADRGAGPTAGQLPSRPARTRGDGAAGRQGLRDRLPPHRAHRAPCRGADGQGRGDRPAPQGRRGGPEGRAALSHPCAIGDGTWLRP